MTLFTSAIPVWLNITCGNGHHREYQMAPDETAIIDEQGKEKDWSCNECGSREIAKINISGSANANMTTLEEVRSK